jgi:hypothetical protein
MNAVATINEASAALVEKVIIEGDLSKLTPSERVNYYNAVCSSVGLNPLTKPFSYLSLNNKLVLYALKACTDQLRYIHKVSVESLTNTTLDGVYIVTAKVKNGDGRTDVDDGAVNIGGLKGEALANAVMKASTKAKRRATLSICGLGMLDETEVETIPGARTAALEAQDGHSAPEAIQAQPAPEPPPAPKMTPQDWTAKALERIAAISNYDGLTDFEGRFETHLVNLKEKQPELHKQVMDAMQAKSMDLG